MSIVERNCSLASAVVFTSFVLSGCGSGDPDDIPAVPAAGSVNYKGKPIEKGTIYFQPEKGKPANGEIKDGQFTLSTYVDGDGAVPGKHKVGVEVTQTVKVKEGDTGLKYLIPEQFASPENSGITVTIPPEGSHKIVVNVGGK